MVIALPEKTLLKTLQFDCKDAGGACARHIAIDVSDQGPAAGWVRIAEVELAKSGDNQTFPVGHPAPGRWLKLTIQDNHGSPDYIQLNDFRAGGEQLTHTAPADVSGTYKTSLGDMHIKQEGASITGCYYTRGGVFTGGVEGHLVKVKWCDNCKLSSKETGPADLVFSPAGDRFIGLYWGQAPNSRAQGKWDGERVSREVGSCPQWAGGAEAQLSQDLTTDGRARLDGVNFDTDSDRLRPESNGVLDRTVAVLKARPTLKVRVEGHTDAVATPAYNLDLSRRRAAAVADYLKRGGIEPSRLATAGFGSDRPVASNDTGLGRAQNRRVELAVQ
jgi:outer membrane protein OmpA-like peptidoglycan-associated protein